MKKNEYMDKDTFINMITNLNFECIRDFDIDLITNFEDINLGVEEPKYYNIRYIKEK